MSEQPHGTLVVAQQGDLYWYWTIELGEDICVLCSTLHRTAKEASDQAFHVAKQLGIDVDAVATPPNVGTS